MANGIKIDCEHLKPVPVGKSDWEGFCQTNYTVDKTLLIKELLDDDTGVALFTRPRLFGKTTALRMLKAFFEKAPKDTSYLFKPFEIWAAGEKCRAEQGKYPVIYLMFRDHKGLTWNSAVSFMRDTMAAEVGRHSCVLSEVEVKAAKTARQSLRKLAQEARDQIDRKNYVAEMSAAGVTDILKLGLAYYKKRVELAR